jgi:hypothetical protein
VDNSLSTDIPIIGEAVKLVELLVSTGPASLAWELVPFSFVLDWFVDSSEIFDRLDNLFLGGPKTITDIWVTDRFELNMPCVLHTSNGIIHGLEGQQVGSCRLKHYHRKPYSNDFSIVPAGRFGKKQAALSAALIHQVVANLRR